MRKMPTPPRPGGVAWAIMVSEVLITFFPSGIYGYAKGDQMIAFVFIIKFSCQDGSRPDIHL
jgi:hypothetical protein